MHAHALSSEYGFTVHSQTLQSLKKLVFEIEDHNALDSNGDAPLHSYVKRTDKERFDCLVTFLTYSKCDVNFLNIEGQTALHLACIVSHCSFFLCPWFSPAHSASGSGGKIDIVTTTKEIKGYMQQH